MLSVTSLVGESLSSSSVSEDPAWEIGERAFRFLVTSATIAW